MAPHGSYYLVDFLPKKIRWFLGIIWSSYSEMKEYRSKDWKRIIMGTTWVFNILGDEDEIPKGYNMDLNKYFKKVLPRIKEGQRIVRKWTKEARDKFSVRIKAKVDPDWGHIWLVFEFTPRSFKPEKIKRAFKALKYAYEGALNELKEKKMVILDDDLDRFVIVP